MNKKAVGLIWVAGLVLALAAPAAAQSTSVRSVIPFEFSVGQTTMPAGEYVIRFDRQFEALWVAGIELAAKTSTPTRWMAAGPDVVPGEAKVIFNRYGDAYFLSQVWDGLRAGSFRVSPSTTERELAQSASAAARQVVTLLARR